MQQNKPVEQLYARHTDKANQNGDVVDNVVDKSDDVVNDTNDNHALSTHDRRNRLLKLISENASCSITELALIIGVTKRTVDRNLSWLKEQGYISREGNSKKGYWKVLKKIKD